MRNKNAEAQAKYRANRRNNGLFVKLELYIHPLDKIRFKTLEAECRKKRLTEFSENNA